MVGLDLVDGVEPGNGGGGGLAIKGQPSSPAPPHHQPDNGACPGQMSESGRVRWVIEGRGGGIPKAPLLGPRT